MRGSAQWRLMSSCFFSSREKIRTSAMSLWRYRCSTALPKVPVPPVINNVLAFNVMLVISILSRERGPELPRGPGLKERRERGKLLHQDSLDRGVIALLDRGDQ